MPRQKNDFYSKTISNFFNGKDSVLEMAKVISYDSERLVAKVFTMNSKLYRDDVPVLFPSMFNNTGIISPPADNSTAFLFWGPDRQPFLLPMQFNVPNILVENGIQKIDASPGYLDSLLTLKNIKGGEQLIRSMGGAYLFLKNLGQVELGTSRLHRITLSENDGSLDIVNERIRTEIGTHSFYMGPASMDSNVDTRSHLYFSFKEHSNEMDLLPSTDDSTLLEQALNRDIDSINLTEIQPIMTVQMGHVFDAAGNTEKDEQDGMELFSQKIISKDDVTITEQTSKGGRKLIRTSMGDNEVEISFSPQDVNIIQTRMVDGVEKTTHIEINSDGKIVCGEDGSSYELMPVLKWFYEQRT